MVNFGRANKLKVLREKEYGLFLDGQTGNTNDDIFLHKKNIISKDIKIGDEIEVFVYRDSQKRLVASEKMPLACEDEVAILRVCDNTDIGCFIDIGLERDVLVPFREKKYPVFIDQYYPFYVYIDKTGRLAATTDVEPHLSLDSNLQQGDICSGYVIGFQTNGTALICIEGAYLGIILKEEYYTSIKEGDKLENLRVIKIYEDGRVGLTTRSERRYEIDNLEKRIISYLEGNDGFMRFNDKSDPEELRIVFNTSKKNFKRTLGTMMKNKLIVQDEEGTRLI